MNLNAKHRNALCMTFNLHVPMRRSEVVEVLHRVGVDVRNLINISTDTFQCTNKYFHTIHQLPCLPRTQPPDILLVRQGGIFPFVLSET